MAFKAISDRICSLHLTILINQIVLITASVIHTLNERDLITDPIQFPPGFPVAILQGVALLLESSVFAF